MARTVRDANLETRTARQKLAARGKPYWRTLEPGQLHLGYRKAAKGAGKWVARYYVGQRNYVTETLANADDFSDADGVAVLDFRQAQEMARERSVARVHADAGKTGPLTVADVMKDYLEFMEGNRKSAADARYRSEAFIEPVLGHVEVRALTAQKIRHWHLDMAKAPPRLRTPEGKAQAHRDTTDDPEAARRRKATANRTLTVLKAALNRAWREGKVSSDEAWRRVEPFESVEAARVRYLTVKEAQRLINACEPDFRRLVEGALQTGCRYGELVAMKIVDYNPDTGTLAVRDSKSGKPRHVVLTDEGQAFFNQITAGRSGADWLFKKADGSPWGRGHQSRHMKTACEAARLEGVSFHILRHTWASLSVMAGVPLAVVAQNLGHADTRMVEKHYGHMSPSFVAEAIRAGAPRFGMVKKTNVEVL